MLRLASPLASSSPPFFTDLDKIMYLAVEFYFALSRGIRRKKKKGAEVQPREDRLTLGLELPSFVIGLGCQQGTVENGVAAPGKRWHVPVRPLHIPAARCESETARCGQAWTDPELTKTRVWEATIITSSST